MHQFDRSIIYVVCCHVSSTRCDHCQTCVKLAIKQFY